MTLIKPLIKETLALVICLIGLSPMSIPVAGILKEWQLISNSLHPVWVTIPLLVLFIVKEIIHSLYIKDDQELQSSPQTISYYLREKKYL